MTGARDLARTLIATGTPVAGARFDNGTAPCTTDFAVICRRPALFAELIRTMRSLPDHAVARVVREVRDGDW